MKNVNFLYEFKTPFGLLPMGYQLTDLPIIFSEINDITDNKNDHMFRCSRDDGPFRVLTNTIDLYFYLKEFSNDEYKFSRVLVKDLTKEQIRDDYNIFLIGSDHEEPITTLVATINFNDVLTKKSFDLFKKHDNVKIVIVDNKEGCFEYEDIFFENVYKFVTEHNLRDDKIIFITNTSNIDEIYKNYLNKYNLESFMTCGSCNFLIFDDPGRNIINYEISTKNYTIDKITERGDDYSLSQFPETNPREKYYLCLNRNSERFHRPKLILELIRYNLFDKGLVSLHKSEGFDSWAEKPKNLHYKTHIKDKYPFIIDYDDPDHVANLHNYFSKKDMWNQTYFSVVNETGVIDGPIFITEKTLKPMIYFHPFIVYGNPGILQEIKKLGFETFPEFFDESYDLIKDETERLNQIIKNVKKVCDLPLEELHNLYHSVYPKLIHNRNVLIDFSKNNYSLTKLLEILNI